MVTMGFDQYLHACGSELGEKLAHTRLCSRVQVGLRTVDDHDLSSPRQQHCYKDRECVCEPVTDVGWPLPLTSHCTSKAYRHEQRAAHLFCRHLASRKQV